MPTTTEKAIAALTVQASALCKKVATQPELITFTPRRIVRSIAGDGSLVFSLAELPPVSFPKTAPSSLPARIKKQELRGIAALASYAEQGKGYDEMTDAQVWDAALEMAREIGASGEQARRLSTTVSLLLLARRGCPDVKPWELP